MSHRTTGLYKLLERPNVYRRLQALLGGPGALARFATEFVRPSAGATLLDVGCGVGSLLEYLPAGVSYAGFDVNPAYIDAARRRYGRRGRFFCARVGEEPPEIAESTFDLIVAVALLHHLDDDDAHRLLGTAARLLAPGGAFVSIDGTLHSGQRRLSELLVRLDRGCAVRPPEGYRSLAEAYFPHVESWLVTNLLGVPYSHFIMRGAMEPTGCNAKP